MTVSAPFTTELARVNSLAVTFGLILAAGMALRNRPLLSCFLIACSVNFRIANILMVVPVLLFLPFLSLNNAEGRIQNFVLLIKYGMLSILAVIPLLYYNYQLLGNPLASTYSSIDAAVNNGSSIIPNLLYYINADQHWLMFHLISIALLLIFCIKHTMKWTDFFKALIFPLTNYIFFIWHRVTMDYYPYASAILLLGIAFGLASELKTPQRWPYVSTVFGILIAFVVLVSGINKFRKKDHKTFDQAKTKYSTLCNFDVVWCDLFSGTTEYVCNNNGFRFATSTPRARKIVMKYLQKKQLDQVIILEDIPLPQVEIMKEIRESELVFTILSDKQLGPLVVIKGDKSVNKIKG